MLKNFQSYQLALNFHQQVKHLKLPAYLRSQLLRAASSIALNLAEGSGKITAKEQRRFYSIALGSQRECHAALDLAGITDDELYQLIGRLGGCIYRLCYPKN